MGTFHTTIEVAASADGPFEAVEALVEPRATRVQLPGELLEVLGVQRKRMEQFILKDGGEAEMPVGDIWLRIGDRTSPGVAVFNSLQSPPVLGANALLGLGLEFDPEQQELVPATLYLAHARDGGTP